MSWLVSDDPPGRIALNIVMLAILLALVFAPFLFPGTKALGVSARICIFVILVASYDLMLGYTGIVSFAHTMFFGIGAYGVAIMLAKGWVGWGAVILGAAAGAVVAAVVAALIGMLKSAATRDLLLDDHACHRQLRPDRRRAMAQPDRR